ncbi:MAG: ribbon-helix-helix protein, CopG family [Myxococcales bacterium]|jgi:hypothetical protein
MIRTLVSLDEEDKAWLDRRAAAEGVPMTELIRRAVRLLRAHEEPPAASLDELLDKTKGLWRRGDGLEYQRASRDEW